MTALDAELSCLRRIVAGLDSPLSVEARQVWREISRGPVMPSQLWRAVPIAEPMRRLDVIDELVDAGLVTRRYVATGGFFHYVATARQETAA